MRRFLETVVWCSEKAAGLARACRKEKDLFQLLVEVSLIIDIGTSFRNISFLHPTYIIFAVNNMNFFTQEKIGDQKNAAYSQDFKTLADVLIQETVRHDLGRHYPELKDNIHVIIAY